MSELRYVRVVSLWLHPGQEAAFEAFEREAARIMAGMAGGSILRSGSRPAGQGIAPYEVHVVSFPDRAAADSYAAIRKRWNSGCGGPKSSPDRGAGGESGGAVQWLEAPVFPAVPAKIAPLRQLAPNGCLTRIGGGD